jgi:hypothetical protein
MGQVLITCLHTDPLVKAVLQGLNGCPGIAPGFSLANAYKAVSPDRGADAGGLDAENGGGLLGSVKLLFKGHPCLACPAHLGKPVHDGGGGQVACETEIAALKQCGQAGKHVGDIPRGIVAGF